jgi:hypothetical protein
MTRLSGSGEVIFKGWAWRIDGIFNEDRSGTLSMTANEKTGKALPAGSRWLDWVRWRLALSPRASTDPGEKCDNRGNPGFLY